MPPEMPQGAQTRQGATAMLPQDGYIPNRLDYESCSDHFLRPNLRIACRSIYRHGLVENSRSLALNSGIAL